MRDDHEHNDGECQETTGRVAPEGVSRRGFSDWRDWPVELRWSAVAHRASFGMRLFDDHHDRRSGDLHDRSRDHH